MVFGFLKKKSAKAKRPKKVRKVKSKSKRKVKRGGKAFGGYQIKPDENLAKVIGNKPVSPSEMTKKLWAYIKQKKLAKK